MPSINGDSPKWKGSPLPDDPRIQHFARQIEHCLEIYKDGIIYITVDAAIEVLERMIVLHDRATQAEDRVKRLTAMIDGCAPMRIQEVAKIMGTETPAARTWNNL